MHIAGIPDVYKSCSESFLYALVGMPVYVLPSLLFGSSLCTMQLYEYIPAAYFLLRTLQIQVEISPVWLLPYPAFKQLKLFRLLLALVVIILKAATT